MAAILTPVTRHVCHDCHARHAHRQNHRLHGLLDFTDFFTWSSIIIWGGRGEVRLPKYKTQQKLSNVWGEAHTNAPMKPEAYAPGYQNVRFQPPPSILPAQPTP